MANRTMKGVAWVHGQNPQFLVEKIIRQRIYECRYWREHCFALTAASIVEKAVALRSVGGTQGGTVQPTDFLCLVLKLLQLQPEKEIVVAYIQNEHFKYLTALGCMYMRLIGSSLDAYNYLEPLYADYRKLRRQTTTGSFEIVYMDEFVDNLLREDRYCDLALPHIVSRQAMEEMDELEPRVSAVEVQDSSSSSSDSSSDDDSDGSEAGGEGPSRPLDTAATTKAPRPDDKTPRDEPVSKGPERREQRPRSRSRSPDRGRRRSPSPRRRSRSPRRRSASPRRRRSSRSRSRSREGDRYLRRRSRSRSPRRRRSRSRSPRRRRRSRSRSRSPRRRDDRRRGGDRWDSRDRDRSSRRRPHSPSRSPPRRSADRDRPRSPSASPPPAAERDSKSKPSKPKRDKASGGKSTGRHKLRFKGDKKEAKEKPADSADAEMDEIAEQNALRAKLGLKPLRP